MMEMIGVTDQRNMKVLLFEKEKEYGRSGQSDEKLENT